MDSLNNYDCQNTPALPSDPRLDPIDCALMEQSGTIDTLLNIIPFGEEGFTMTDEQVDSIMAFFRALTDLGQVGPVPTVVPSGLPVDQVPNELSVLP